MTEYEIHRRFVAELRRSFRRFGFARGTEPFFHCPNESRATARWRSKLAAMGLSKGVPDLIIVHPLGVYLGAALELKAERGRATAEQKRWLETWAAARFDARVLRGAAECADWGRSVGLFDEIQADRLRAA